jgi:hypothetical protein
MRYRWLIFSMFFSSALCAQTVREADALFAAKKYSDAAAIYENNYYYEKAAESYRKFIESLPKKRREQESENLQPAIDRADRLARMVARCEDVQIIDSVVIDKNQFLNAYLLSDEAGNLMQERNRIVYENQLQDRRVFGDKLDGQFSRLYLQDKIQAEWSAPRPVNVPTDSTGNDAYPFFLTDGMTMYFASTGNGSIGGYDIFVSRYSIGSGEFLTPTPLGMPFNSIYNDYLYAIDELNGIGYFATDRFQPDDKVVVYTFIPNESFTPLEGAPIETLTERAKISSIKDTWREGKNYRSMLASIRESIINKPVAIKKDFTFVINDNIVYYTLSDFQSDAAKRNYLNAAALEKQILTLENQLEEKRKTYISSDKTTRKSLAAFILNSESQLAKLNASYRISVKEARNLEIKYLRNTK